MNSDMNLIMEGWRGYLLEEQAIHELHQELLAEDFASILQKLKDVPSTIKGKIKDLKNLKNNAIEELGNLWLKAGTEALNATGSIKDFINDKFPPKYQAIALPVLLGILAAAAATGRCSSCQSVIKQLAAGDGVDMTLVAGFIFADLPNIIQLIPGLAEGMARRH